MQTTFPSGTHLTAWIFVAPSLESNVNSSFFTIVTSQFYPPLAGRRRIAAPPDSPHFVTALWRPAKLLRFAASADFRARRHFLFRRKQGQIALAILRAQKHSLRKNAGQFGRL